MMIMDKFMGKPSQKWTDYAWLAIRLALALVLVMHGWQKLAGGMDGFIAMLDKLSFPMPVVLAWLVALLEFFGGIAIAIGLCTRDVAAMVTIQFAIILIFVKKFAFPMSDTDILVFGAALALALVGAGGMSVDAKMKRNA